MFINAKLAGTYEFTHTECGNSRTLAYIADVVIADAIAGVMTLKLFLYNMMMLRLSMNMLIWRVVLRPTMPLLLKRRRRWRVNSGLVMPNDLGC